MAKIEKKNLCDMALVRVTAKIEKNKPFDRAKKERINILCRALVRIRTKKEKNTLFGRTLVR